MLGPTPPPPPPPPDKMSKIWLNALNDNSSNIYYFEFFYILFQKDNETVF